MNKRVSLLILGAGGRSTIYARLAALTPDKVQVVGVAEPREFFRERLADEHGIAPEYRFSDWRDAAALPRFADAVIIGMQDRMHVEPAEAFAKLGYHILIEKPLAPDVDGCRRIVEAAMENNIIFSVCHVMRYAEYTGILRNIIDSGAIGEIMSIKHLEPVGHWRYAHAYVRGNWNREEESSSVLLAKSIHDLDWLYYIMFCPVKRISSFGDLSFFRRENMPKYAAQRCLDCQVAEECPYNAPKFYLARLKSGTVDNYLESVTGVLTEEAILEAMRSGPYGRCVFACDNDVADHQVVSMEFVNGATATFSLVGASRFRHRETNIFGSLGEIYCDSHKITIYSYLRGTTSVINIEPENGTVERHHGGGDKGCFDSFIDAVRTGDRNKILASARIALESHLMVFAAEQSRKEGRTISMQEFCREHNIPDISEL